MEQYSRSRGSSALAAASLIGIATAGLLIAMQRSRPRRTAAGRRASSGVHVHEAITVNRPLPEVYQFWRNFENFPTFMSYIERVETSGNRSRWRAKGLPGTKVEWEAEIVRERENESIAWRSLEGSDVAHYGSVRFEDAPGARGTEVHVELRYDVRGGALTRGLARIFGRDPEQQIRYDLRRFKQLLEAGEIPLSDGPGLWRPAQPPERPEDVRAYMGVVR